MVTEAEVEVCLAQEDGRFGPCTEKVVGCLTRFRAQRVLSEAALFLAAEHQTVACDEKNPGHQPTAQNTPHYDRGAEAGKDRDRL